jgi:hypothetical protein
VRRLVLAAWLALASAGAAADHGGSATGGTGAFAERARDATARYQDRAAAIADGYRLIGEDFPGMGEHWIHIGRVFDGAYDATRPEILTYVTLAGTPRLLGIAYALPLLDGEVPPEEPAGRAAWHAHAGSIDDETLAPHHHHSGHADHGPRLAMVHAWVWFENPEGLFAADNWAIPFLRLGLEAPRQAAPEAGKALSLLTGGDAYVARVVRSAVEPGTLDEAALRAVIAGASGTVAAVVERRSGARLPPEALAALTAAWQALWSDIEAMLPAEAAARLAAQSMR